jgi:hypothetical protein
MKNSTCTALKRTSFKALIFFAFFLAIQFISVRSYAQGSTASDTVELTEVDITTLSSFNATHATVYGVALGMRYETASELLARQKFLKVEKDPMNIRRYIVYEKNDTGKVAVALLKFYKTEDKLYQIVLFPPFSKHLKGGSCNIMSMQCMDPNADVYKQFLGAAASSTVELNLPSIKTKNTLYYYPKMSLIIEELKNDGQVKYNLILNMHE